jgi:hypothetical protein
LQVNVGQERIVYGEIGRLDIFNGVFAAEEGWDFVAVALIVTKIETRGDAPIHKVDH